MRVDLREVELARDQEDHGADGRKSAVAASLAFGRMEEAIQGLQEAVGGACLGLSTDAFETGSRKASDGLHGLELGAADVRTPWLQHQAHDIHLFAVSDLAEWLAIHLGPRGALGGHLPHQRLQIIACGGAERAGVLQERKTAGPLGRGRFSARPVA